MKKRDILDLRIIISVFFFCVGIILFADSFILQPTVGKDEKVNLWSGMIYIVFGILMFLLWFKSKNTPEEEEH